MALLSSVFGPALLSLRDVVPFELATLYTLRGDRLEARTAVGPASSPAAERHEVEVDRHPRIRQALYEGRPVMVDDDPLRDVVERPPALACLAVPLRLGHDPTGMLMLLAAAESYTEPALASCMAHGHGLAAALAMAQQVEPVSPLGGVGPLLPLRTAERLHLLAALKQTGGKIYGRGGAAKLLDLKPTTLQSKLKKHGISRLDALGEPMSVSTSPAANRSAAE